MKPLLGFIRVQDRTQAQHDAHQTALKSCVKFSLPVPKLAKGEAVRLTDAWKDPKVVADVGFVFERFHQLTGSCVNCGGANAVFSTLATQRLASTNPTKAFLPFTWHNYAMSRHYLGDDSQGEGSTGSTFAQSLTQDGIIDWVGSYYPSYTKSDGVSITSDEEMEWSSYRYSKVAPTVAKSKAHLFGSAGQCKTVQDIKAMILNGYGVTFACDKYIGNGSIVNGGGTPYVCGEWDGDGGHQQSVHNYFEHPNDGPLYWVQNNWPGNTYPKDPLGGPTCGVWVKEEKVTEALSYDAEVFGLSHLQWFPANPDVPATLNWSSI